MSLIPIFTIYAVNMETEGKNIKDFSFVDCDMSFFNMIKKAVKYSELELRDFVVTPEMVDSSNPQAPFRVSKRNIHRVINDIEICVKDCFLVSKGRFHFKKCLVATSLHHFLPESVSKYTPVLLSSPLSFTTLVTPIPLCELSLLTA